MWTGDPGCPPALISVPQLLGLGGSSARSSWQWPPGPGGGGGRGALGPAGLILAWQREGTGTGHTAHVGVCKGHSHWACLVLLLSALGAAGWPGVHLRRGHNPHPPVHTCDTMNSTHHCAVPKEPIQPGRRRPNRCCVNQAGPGGRRGGWQRDMQQGPSEVGALSKVLHLPVPPRPPRPGARSVSPCRGTREGTVTVNPELLPGEEPRQEAHADSLGNTAWRGGCRGSPRPGRGDSRKDVKDCPAGAGVGGLCRKKWGLRGRRWGKLRLMARPGWAQLLGQELLECTALCPDAPSTSPLERGRNPVSQIPTVCQVLITSTVHSSPRGWGGLFATMIYILKGGN
jgi:hypothetical protein